MAKVQKTSRLQPTSHFTELNILESYRDSFHSSEPGKLHQAFHDFITINSPLEKVADNHYCSGSDLFLRVNFYMLTRSALGFMSLKDKTPSPSTWYLFREKIVKYDEEHGIDLMQKCIAQITGEQMLEFNVAGGKIRVDSKLIGSNIANCTRYGLIHDTIALFLEEREKYIKKRRFSNEDTRLMKDILEQTGEHAVYTKSDVRVKADLPRLGKLIQHLLKVFQKYPHGH